MRHRARDYSERPERILAAELLAGRNSKEPKGGARRWERRKGTYYNCSSGAEFGNCQTEPPARKEQFVPLDSFLRGLGNEWDSSTANYFAFVGS